MDCLWIEGSSKGLHGEVEIPPAKNAALPLLSLCLLTAKKVHFKNLPAVADIHTMVRLLKGLGVQQADRGVFECAKLTSIRAPYEEVKKMRASVVVLGPLLAREGAAEVSLPGGCAIGQRPVDIHLKGLEALGASISIEEGYIKARTKKLKGARFILDFPTVTGTINLLTAATLAEGDTVLENVAREPEVVEICQALRAMGAQISGEGSSRIEIKGVSELHGLEWEIQPDRIQFLTYLAAGAIAGGEVTCYPYRAGTLDLPLQKFREMGCNVEEMEKDSGLRAVKISRIAKSLLPIHLETAPFPGFPTDGQAQFVACLSTADSTKGSSVVKESVFENRFQHVSELCRMGARIEVEGNTAIIQGVPELSGATVMASDLRASASLVLAGLVARGKTKVSRVYHLDRGYQDFEGKLSKLGAKVWRAVE